MVENPKGNYRFLPGISPYSCGVVADAGYEIIHTTLSQPVPYRRGFDIIAACLERLSRPRQALCGIALRSPTPFTLEGFIAFNRGYKTILEDWDLMVEGINPVARTNVAPEVGPPPEPALHAFSCTVPSEEDGSTFVVAGAGEVREGRLDIGSIVRSGETSPEAMAEKAAYVMGCMSERLSGLGVSWADATATDVYTVYDISPFLRSHILSGMSDAVQHGIRWHFARPPIVDVEFEMDVRGVRVEQLLRV